MSFFPYLIAIIAGACFGSFGLVLFQRLGKDASRKSIKSILVGRSVCDHTGECLKRYELIPILSYLVQQGKSRYTRKQLSPSYLRAEIGTACIFLLTTWRGITNLLPWHEIIFRCITNSVMLGLFVYDIQKLELHLPLRLILVLWVLIWQFTGVVGDYRIAFFGSIAMGLVFLGLYYGAQYYLQRRYGTKQEGLGEGDIYMAFLLGALSPFVFLYQGIFPSRNTAIQLGLDFLIVSCLIGLLLALLMRRFGYTAKQIPFIPAMILGFYVLLCIGSLIIN